MYIARNLVRTVTQHMWYGLMWYEWLSRRQTTCTVMVFYNVSCAPVLECRDSGKVAHPLRALGGDVPNGVDCGRC